MTGRGDTPGPAGVGTQRFLVEPGVHVPVSMAGGVLSAMRDMRDKLARERIPLTADYLAFMEALAVAAATDRPATVQEPPPRWITTAVAAGILGVTTRHVRNLIKTQELTVHRADGGG
jgi:hypothetical protein